MPASTHAITLMSTAVPSTSRCTRLVEERDTQEVHVRRRDEPTAARMPNPDAESTDPKSATSSVNAK